MSGIIGFSPNMKSGVLGKSVSGTTHIKTLDLSGAANTGTTFNSLPFFFSYSIVITDMIGGQDNAQIDFRFVNSAGSALSSNYNMTAMGIRHDIDSPLSSYDSSLSSFVAAFDRSHGRPSQAQLRLSENQGANNGESLNATLLYSLGRDAGNKCLPTLTGTLTTVDNNGALFGSHIAGNIVERDTVFTGFYVETNGSNFENGTISVSGIN